MLVCAIFQRTKRQKPRLEARKNRQNWKNKNLNSLFFVF
jgi:hypothetical protein